MELFNLKFSNDIGIDLGTANTLVYVRGHGIIINEPSVVAVNRKTNKIVAIGIEAKNMLGRTPGHIEVVRPLVDGVISDFEVTEEMLAYLINKAEKVNPKILRPRVVIGVPSGITTVEIKAVYDAARNAGAREVFIVEEPLAAAIGMRLPIHEPTGTMVIDIGGGTTDIAIMSLGGIVFSKNIKVAGDRFNNEIIEYLRNERKILIGEKTAEKVKMALASAIPGDQILEIIIKGRDLITGLPREELITDTDIRGATGPLVTQLLDAIKESLESIPPELLSDVMHSGIAISGGGALMSRLPELVERELRIPVHVGPDPLLAVVQGTGFILEDLDLYRDVLIKEHEEFSPR